MRILRKIIGCKHLGNSQENVYDGVHFIKIASPQCRDSKSTINRLDHRFFSEYVPKISSLKKNILRKVYMVYQRLNNVAVVQCAVNFTKNRVHVKNIMPIPMPIAIPMPITMLNADVEISKWPTFNLLKTHVL